MPQRKNMTWGEIPKQRVRNFLEVLLDKHNYAEDLLSAEWQSLDGDRHRLYVHYTTKTNLVRLSRGNRYPSMKQKAEIQDAIAHLEELQILTDLRSVKTGAKAEKLSFYLDLPTRNSSDILNFILCQKWPNKSVEKTKTKDRQSNSTSFGDRSDRPIAVASPEYEAIAEIEQWGNQTIIRWRIKFSGSVDQLTPESIAKMQTTVRKLAGDRSQNIMDIHEGSIVIEFEGSEAGFRRIQTLLNRGELTEIEGFPIEAVEVVPQPIHLSQWQSNRWPTGWQELSSLLTPSQYQFAFGWRSGWEPETIAGQTIAIAGISLVLAIASVRESNNQTSILLQLHPTGNDPTLPAHLELILRDRTGQTILTTATENSNSNILQLEIKGDPGEEFTLNISRENDTITKRFVI
ncbi:MAG: DUF1822 family protein [Cyanobacteria bacterium J007]|nr:MAG: DUF1822 family protein [Cyanobacteria bacterium J007]